MTTLSLHHLSKRGTGELLCKGVCLKMQYTPEMDSAVDLVVPHFRETQLDRHFTSVLRHSHLHLNPGSMDGKSLKRTLRSSIIQRTSRTAVNFKPNSWSRHVWLLNPAIDFEAAKHSHRLGEWRKWHSSHRPSTAADMVAGGRAWQAGPSSWDPLVISAVISVSADHHVAKHFTSRRIHTGATGGSLTLWLCQQFAIENGHL